MEQQLKLIQYSQKCPEKGKVSQIPILESYQLTLVNILLKHFRSGR